MSHTAYNLIKKHLEPIHLLPEEETKLLNEVFNSKIRNEEAWSTFYNTYSRFVFMVANKILHDEDEAEDMVQEIFVKCIEQFNQFDQTQPFRPWLSAVIKNYCINELKRKGTKPTHYIGAVSADDCFTQSVEDSIYFSAIDTRTKTPYEYALVQETSKLVKKVLKTLKPDFKEVIELKYFDEMSYEQIAKYTKKPIGTIMSRLFNAKRKMAYSYKEKVINHQCAF